MKMNFKNFKQLDVEELYKRDPQLKKDDVLTVLDWADKQPHLPKISEFQAALAVHSCYYRIEAAKKTVDSYFTLKTMCKDLFGDRDPSQNHILRTVIDVSFVTVLPKLTPEGYTVVLTKLIDFNPDLYNLPAALRLCDMVFMLHLHRSGPTNGIIIVMDMQGGTLGHLMKLNLSIFRKFVYYLQTAWPIRLIAVHHINVVPFLDKLMAMIKPFIDKDLFQKLIYHPNSIDTLYDSIPRSCMPLDYGGECETCPILIEKYKRDMLDNRDFFEYEENQTVDESKRPGKPTDENDLFGIEGTFKKLEVD